MTHKKINNKRILHHFILLFFMATFTFAGTFQGHMCETVLTTLQFQNASKKQESTSLGFGISKISVKAKNAETHLELTDGTKYFFHYDPEKGWCFKYDSPTYSKEAFVQFKKIKKFDVVLRGKINGSKDYCSFGGKIVFLVNDDKQAVGTVEVISSDSKNSIKVTPLKSAVSLNWKTGFTQFEKAVNNSKDYNSQLSGSFGVSASNSSNEELLHSYKLKTKGKNKTGNIEFSQSIVTASHSDISTNKNNTRGPVAKMFGQSSLLAFGCPVVLTKKQNIKNPIVREVRSLSGAGGYAIK